MKNVTKSRSSGKKTKFRRLFLLIISLIFVFGNTMAQSGAWTKKKDVPIPIAGAGSCVIDNKIYVIGGLSFSFADIAAVQVYDPAKDEWSTKKDMITKRAFLSTAIVDGIIYGIGGGYPNSTKIVEAYDPAADTWTTKKSMLSPRLGAQAAVVDGIIYNIGGNYSERNCEAYDPKTNTWTSKSPIPQGGGNVSVTEYNGLIYVFGGGYNAAFSVVFAYDPKTDTWTKKKDMPTARFSFRTYLLDGKIYAIGGSQGQNQSLPTIEMYDPATDTWTKKPDMPFKRAMFAGSVVNGKIYVIGGTPDWQTGGDDIWQYDPTIETNVPAGNVSGTWTRAKSPYIISGEITIPKDLTLTIEAGVQVVFLGHYKFNVQGRLLALGTKTDSIRFTAQDQKAGWHGIRFDQTPSTNDTSKLYYCSFKYGKAITGDYDYGELERAGGAIMINGYDKVLISGCLFESNMNIGYSNPTGGAAIYIQWASPTVEKSTFQYNSGSSDGSIKIAYASQAIIKNNKIFQNTAQWYALGCSFTADNKPLISGNTISNNVAILGGGGIYCSDGSNARIENNIIVHNQAPAGGVVCYNSGNPVIINNTIADNKASYYGGGVYCDSSSSPIFINNIIYGNSAPQRNQVYINDNNSDPHFLYCDIQGGMEAFQGAGAGTSYGGTYKNNIDKNPVLQTAPLNFYELAGYSPCIGAGIDSVEVSGMWYSAPKYCIKGHARPSPAGSKPDLGACEHPSATPADPPLVVKEELNIPKEFTLNQNYPNPFNPTTVISYQLPVSSQVTLKVYDILGNELMTLVNEYKPAGTYKVSWNAENLSSGIYFYKIKAGSNILTKKMILLR